MDNAYERVCAAVEDTTGQHVKLGRAAAKGICPAHDDEQASLSIRDTSPVGVTCFAGCSFTEIRDALGLKNSDFRNQTLREVESPKVVNRKRDLAPDKGRLGAEVARYAYSDESGRPLYYNIRYEPKAFRMAGPDGHVGKLPDNMARVPYNLPAVVKAVRAGNPVYWVEGEKDVAALARVGQVGTTSAGGAQAPIDPEWAQWFRGADLVVVADRDKVGEEYARKVAKVMVNSATRVRLAQSATETPKSDVADHLAAGHGLDGLVWLPSSSVRRTRWTLASILSTEPAPLKWAIPNVIPEGLTLLVGAPKAGKSWLNLNIQIALASGRPDDVFGWGGEIEPSPSLYLALEDPHRRLHYRISKVLANLPRPTHDAGDVWLDLPPILDGGKQEIEQWLEQHPTARCVMVDVLAKVRTTDNQGGGMYQADYESVGVLKDIADAYGVAVVVTHHDRKKTSDDYLDAVSGTKGITGAADTILYLQRERGSNEGIMRSESRDVEECTYQMQFVKEQGRWHILERTYGEGSSSSAAPDESIAFELAQLILTRGPSRPSELAKHLKKDLDTVRQVLDTQAQGGHMTVDSAGRYDVAKKVTDAPE